VGDDGKTHQGLFDLSYLGLIPNLRIAAPRNGLELQNMLFSALKLGHPVAIRYPRGPVHDYNCEQDFTLIPEGKAEILRTGNDLTLLAVGPAASVAFQSAGWLAQHGIETTVIDARWVKPLDHDMIIEAGRHTGRIITVEENVIAGGFGASVTQLCAERLPASCIVRNIGIPDVFVMHASQESLRKKFGLDAQSIANYALKVFPELELKFRNPAIDPNTTLGNMAVIK
jgi:1-deoxy-D-xylulose-5-phosphate synthase